MVIHSASTITCNGRVAHRASAMGDENSDTVNLATTIPHENSVALDGSSALLRESSAMLYRAVEFLDFQGTPAEFAGAFARFAGASGYCAAPQTTRPRTIGKGAGELLAPTRLNAQFPRTIVDFTGGTAFFLRDLGQFAEVHQDFPVALAAFIAPRAVVIGLDICCDSDEVRAELRAGTTLRCGIVHPPRTYRRL
jgi:hypothetical protein